MHEKLTHNPSPCKKNPKKQKTKQKKTLSAWQNDKTFLGLLILSLFYQWKAVVCEYFLYFSQSGGWGGVSIIYVKKNINKIGTDTVLFVYAPSPFSICSDASNIIFFISQTTTTLNSSLKTCSWFLICFFNFTVFFLGQYTKFFQPNRKMLNFLQTSKWNR